MARGGVTAPAAATATTEKAAAAASVHQGQTKGASLGNRVRPASPVNHGSHVTSAPDRVIARDASLASRDGAAIATTASVSPMAMVAVAAGITARAAGEAAAAVDPATRWAVVMTFRCRCRRRMGRTSRAVVEDHRRGVVVTAA